MTRLGARTVRPEEQAVLTARRKFLRRRRARRWHVWRRLLVGLLLVGLLAGLLWLVLFSSYLASAGTEVTGTDSLREELVVETADVPLGVPLARLDLDAIEARVEGLAAVKSAEVSRSWPDQVRIDVTERTPVAAVLWEGRWRGLDESGVLFRDFDRRPPELPVVEMRAATPVDALAEGAAVVSALPDELLRRVESFDVRSIDDITFRLKGGAEVVWGSAEYSEAKAEVLGILLEQKASRYDVSAPGRPTTRG
ncbi:MAG TPA: FtsQ-type POTRA domain-containing protein [Marmoricola sp.]|nr:FtsQ-type POTRA domain-containing protein [Marmoricola sp.]